jgi:hypothetical protein
MGFEHVVLLRPLFITGKRVRKRKRKRGWDSAVRAGVRGC